MKTTSPLYRWDSGDWEIVNHLTNHIFPVKHRNEIETQVSLASEPVLCLLSHDALKSPNGTSWAQSDSKPLSEYTIFFHVCLCSAMQPCSTLCYPWTIAHQAPLSMGFSRQEYRSGLPFHHLLFRIAKLLPDMIFRISFSFWWIPTHSSVCSTTLTPFWGLPSILQI